MRAIHSSCLGCPIPTQTTAAPEPSISALTSSSSAGVSARNGGECPPAIRRPGKRSRRRRSSSSKRALIASAVEVDRGSLRSRRGGACAVEGHQVGAIDARGAGVPERMQRPYERLTVGHGERGAEHGRMDDGILVGRHHEVHGRGRQITAAVAGDQCVHPIHHLDVVGHGQWNPEDLRGFGHRCRGRGSGRGGDCVKIPANPWR